MITKQWLCAPGCVALLATPLAAMAQGMERAVSTERFIDSVGINAHWGYGGSRYADHYPDVKRLLVASGIRHIRADLSRAQDLAASGIKTMAVADIDTHYTHFPAFAPADGNDDTIQAVVAATKKANAPLPAIDSVEGPNETDQFWKMFQKSYKGQGWRPGTPVETKKAYDEAVLQGIIRGTVAFQTDLYEALKADPATKKLTVIGPALGGTYAPNTIPNPLPAGSMTGAVDWGNFHPYPYGGNFDGYGGSYDTIMAPHDYTHAGNFPSVSMDRDDKGSPFAANAFVSYAPPFAPKPMAATETGYPTQRSGTSELAQGKYLPRLFCEYFTHGVRRTFWYELVDEDEFPDPDGNNPECHYGIVRKDLSPKPAYTALKSLLTLLKDPMPAAGFAPAALDYSLAVSPVRGYKEPNSGLVADYDRTQYVHHLLLQKSDGVFYLLLWHEIADEDTSVSPHRQIQPPALPTTISLPPTIAAATVYAYDAGEVLRSMPGAIVRGKLQLDVPDQVLVVRLAPRRVVVRHAKQRSRTSASDTVGPQL